MTGTPENERQREGTRRAVDHAEDVVHDFWATRPSRSNEEGKIAGVAAALGRRYDVDPTVIRVGFVITALYGGAGALFYLLGWVLLPQQRTEDGAPRERWTAWRLVGLAVVVLIGLVGLRSGLTGLISLVLCIAALYLLHRSHGANTRPVTEADRTEEPPTQPLGEQHAPASAAPLGTAQGAAAPPGPEPTTEHTPAPKARNHRVTQITLAAALIVVGVLLGVVTPRGPSQLAMVGAVVLAVLGVGMLAGSVLRGGRGLIAFAIPLALATLLLSALPPRWGAMGDQDVRPTAVDQVRPEYRTSVGDLELDLRHVVFPGNSVTSTRVGSGMGDVTVHVPPGVNVQASCGTGAGDVHCLGQTPHDNSGADTQVHDFGADGVAGGQLVLDADAGIGTVEVLRD